MALDKKQRGEGMEVGGGANSGPSLSYLLGGAGVLQAVLTAVGVSSGGITALVINDEGLVLAGFITVVAGIFLGAFAVATEVKGIARTLLAAIGTILLFTGVGITAYVALVGPAVAKAPSINVALSGPAGVSS